MNCIRTFSYKILVNGTPREQIQPSRGLRQGDSISPYLFLICMEGLSFGLKKLERKDNIEGIKIRRRSLTITHLLFADDCYIFTKTKIKYAKKC